MRSFIFFFLVAFTVNAQQITEIDKHIDTIMHSNISDSLKIDKFSRLLHKFGFTPKTKKILDTMLYIADNSTDYHQFNLASAYKAYGIYYFFNSKLDSSLIMLDKAENIVDKINAPLLKASIIYSKSAGYKRTGNVTMGIKMLLTSKNIFDKIDTLKLNKNEKKLFFTKKMILYNSLANFYNDINEYDKAIAYYDEIFRILHKLNPANAGIILSNKGDVLIKLKKYDEALKVLEQSKELKIKGKAPVSSLATTNMNIGRTLVFKNDFDNALKYLNLSIEQYQKANRIRGIKDALINRANLYYKTRKYPKAIADARRAYDIAKEHKLIDGIQRASHILAQSYEATGDYKNAFLNYKIYEKAKDSVFNEKNIKKITQLEMQNEYEKEKELQKIVAENKERKNRQQIKFLSLGLIALFIIAGLLYRMSYVRRKTNRKLQEKNKQISDALAINEVLMKETHHRVKNNLQIISSLLNMQSRYLTDEVSKEVVKDSQNRIKSMSFIHQQLYQQDELTGIETTVYFSKLIESLAQSFGIDKNKVDMNIRIESMLLDVDTAIPLGLILNELITNAFKHGVDKQTGKFYLSFGKKNDKLEVIIKDNGKGIPEGFDLNKTTSYGMKLVQILAQKLKADIQFINNNGLEIKLIISNFKMKKR